MKTTSWKKSFLALLASAALFTCLTLTTGCATLNEEEESQQVPWSRPADWEGTIPGMPTPRG